MRCLLMLVCGVCSWVVCDDPMCKRRTRQITTLRNGQACTKPGCRGHMRLESSFDAVHTQIDYYNSLFSKEAAKERAEEAERPVVSISADEEELFRYLAEAVDTYHNVSAFRYVDMYATTKQYEDRFGNPLLK